MAVGSRIRFSQSIVVIYLLASPGCSGEESFSLPPMIFGAPSSRYQDACGTWALSDCTYERHCLHFQWEDIDQCVERNTIACELMADDPGISFDEQHIRECTYPSDCATPPPGCWPRGHTAVGQPCIWNEACHSGHCIGGSSALGICGLCVCDIQCAPGQQCLVSAAGSTCIPAKTPSGEACASSEECQSGLCAPGEDGGSVCSPFGQFGDPCGRQGAPSCGGDLSCDSTGRCNSIALVGFGDSCEEDGGPLLRCRGFATCNGVTCVPPAADGQSCPLESACAWPAQCIESHCVFPTVEDCLSTGQ
jgi:hypothetical protein